MSDTRPNTSTDFAELLVQAIEDRNVLNALNRESHSKDNSKMPNIRPKTSTDLLNEFAEDVDEQKEVLNRDRTTFLLDRGPS